MQYRNEPIQLAEQFVQSMLDALADHVAVLDDHGTIVAVNEAWRSYARQNGNTTENFGIGTNYLTICDNASARNAKEAPLIASAIRSIASGQTEEFQLEYPCHSPLQRRWFVVRISRFQWGDVTRVLVAHQNVSDLKHVEVELAQSKRRLEAILDNVNNGIVTLDSHGKILTVNRAVTRIFGCTPDVLMCSHLMEMIRELQEGEISLRSLSGEAGFELTGIRANGQTFPLYLSVNELTLEDGSMYTCIIQDITYRKQVEADRIERERMTVALEKEREIRAAKNRFLSMMSHELRTPLTSIGLSYDILKKYGDISTPEERTQSLDNIRLQVDYLAEMVADVMTLSRFEGDGFDINKEAADLITYCRDVVEEFQLNYHKTHRINFVCDDRQIVAPIDRKLLRRAFTNLLSNAIKYSPQGGKVLFSLKKNGQDAIITVSDEGIGIPEEDQKMLFEPFHRATNVENVPGTGLGLPITRQMIELHRGSIGFKSAVGQGTVFTVRLPL